ncbi:MAG: hypothetical protein LBB26_03180 [Puniceicoccales bacterium]|jgi:hypothetical protein|nr:hypothetical protein [Puniceicoccales bacterium]
MLQEDALIGLFIAVDDVCKKNGWDFSHDSGPACGLHLSEVWTIYSFFQLSGFKHFIARARKNMKKNTSEEIAHLSRRHMVETFLGKLKSRIGESFANFRSWQGAKAAIVIAMATINLGFQPVNAL